MGKRKETLEANRHYADPAFIGKPHFIADCLESFTQITKKHIGFIVAHTNTKLRNTVKYLNSDKALSSGDFPELTLQEELKLMTEYQAGKNSKNKETIKKRDLAARRLIDAHKPIFEKIALKLDPTGRYTDDLVQEGLLFFIASLDKKDLKQRSRVITFTLRMAFRAMERYFYIHRQPIQVTTNQADNLAILKKFVEEFDESLPFDCLVKLIRERFGINEEKALKLLYLYDSVDTDAELELLPDSTELQVSHIEKTDLRKNLDHSLSMLSSRRESVMRLRTGYLHTIYSPNDELTLKEVGKIHGILKERVRQIEADALIKLKMPHVSGNLEEFWPRRKDRR